MPLHSGIEAYCKTAAELCDMPAKMTSWASFAEELFPEMPLSGPKATRIWTMSPVRGTGKSNRLKEFEKGWLNGEDAGARADAAVEDERGRLNRSLEKNEEARCRGKAEFECEKSAIDSCFKNLDGSIESSMVWVLVSGFDSFAVCFHADMLPAIQKGFRSEGYEESDIRVFSNVIDQLASELDASSPLIVNGRSRLPLRNFIKTLFAALIYGPGHPLARNQPDEETSDYSAENRQDLNFEWDTISITQLIESHGAYVGDTLRCESDTAIFIGRSAQTSDYLDKCKELFEADGEVLSLIEESKAAVFNILNRFSNTSNVHGLILFNGNSWDYYDLESSNGTFFGRDGAARLVTEGFLVSRPGDILFLGAAPSPEDGSIPSKAATLLLSCHVDSGSFS